MRKTVFIGYLTISILIFFVGVLSLYAKSGDIITCSTFFPGTCTQGGCTQTDNTYGGGCVILNCSNGCTGYDDKGNCISWDKTPLTCTKPSTGTGGGGTGGGNGGGAGGAGGVGNRPGAGMPGWLPSWDDLNNTGLK